MKINHTPLIDWVEILMVSKPHYFSIPVKIELQINLQHTLQTKRHFYPWL